MSKQPRLGQVWGMTRTERAQPFTCDSLIERADATLYRAITVQAPPPVVFRWLCQLRAAPYSYDWIDNFGRQSPPALIPGLERLAPGQRVMSIFTLVSFEPDRELSLRTRTGDASASVFGDVVGTYRLEPRGNATRLLVKLHVAYPRGPVGACMRRILPIGDLIMMRRQLLNLKHHAEAQSM